MVDPQEYADVLKEAREAKAMVAESMLRLPRGAGRWFLSVGHRIVAWVERMTREDLDDMHNN